jgi:DUF4097 and DUF4098 domain-containing protein YvlB
MSSPGTYAPVPPMPPGPPYLPPRRRRSFAGPVVLIVIGIIFLLGNIHLLSWSRLGTLFAHYWPALLILWGVVKLIEYQQAQRDGVRAPGIGVGGIFLIIVLVFSGLIFTQAERFNWRGLRDQINIDDDDFNNIFGDTFSFDDHLEQNFPAGASLKVIDTHGAVSVHESNDNKITVAVRKRVGADNQSDADKYNNQTKTTITAIGGLITIDAKADGAGDHPIETDLDISLPRKAGLTVNSRRGDVNVVGRDGDITIASQHGDVSVEEIAGNIKLNMEKGSGKVEQVAGDVHIEGRLNEVSITDVNGSAQLNGEFMESVKLARISKGTSFKSSRTDIEFSRLDGELNLDSDDLHADRITGPLHLTTRSKEVRLEDVSGEVRLQNENGGVELSLRSLGNVQIDNRSGDIQISVPDHAGFRVDARTRDGEIQSDFSELKIENSDHEGTATGSVGNATSHLVLNNEHAGIEIRRTSFRPPEPEVTPRVPTPPRSPANKAGKNLPAPKDKIEPTEN